MPLPVRSLGDELFAAVSPSASSSDPSGRHTAFTSEHFAVVISAPYDAGPRKIWHPSTLSAITVGTVPVHCT